ncbi:hypothetical protein BJ742DRAFT_291057 [Cladochytrium replicatum]|nr:hypothetical protein BJ742DRAFT_291057 [Cladochytrium replicatum]
MDLTDGAPTVDAHGFVNGLLDSAEVYISQGNSQSARIVLQQASATHNNRNITQALNGLSVRSKLTAALKDQSRLAEAQAEVNELIAQDLMDLTDYRIFQQVLVAMTHSQTIVQLIPILVRKGQAEHAAGHDDSNVGLDLILPYSYNILGARAAFTQVHICRIAALLSLFANKFDFFSAHEKLSSKEHHASILRSQALVAEARQFAITFGTWLLHSDELRCDLKKVREQAILLLHSLRSFQLTLWTASVLSSVLSLLNPDKVSELKTTYVS